MGKQARRKKQGRCVAVAKSVFRAVVVLLEVREPGQQQQRRGGASVRAKAGTGVGRRLHGHYGLFMRLSLS